MGKFTKCHTLEVCQLLLEEAFGRAVILSIWRKEEIKGKVTECVYCHIRKPNLHSVRAVTLWREERLNGKGIDCVYCHFTKLTIL